MSDDEIEKRKNRSVKTRGENPFDRLTVLRLILGPHPQYTLHPLTHCGSPTDCLCVCSLQLLEWECCFAYLLRFSHCWTLLLQMDKSSTFILPSLPPFLPCHHAECVTLYAVCPHLLPYLLHSPPPIPLLHSQVRRPQAWSRVRQLEIPTGSPFQSPFGGTPSVQRPLQQLGHWVYDPFEARWVWSRMQMKRHYRHLHKRVRRF